MALTNYAVKEKPNKQHVDKSVIEKLATKKVYIMHQKSDENCKLSSKFYFSISMKKISTRYNCHIVRHKKVPMKYFNMTINLTSRDYLI